MLIFISPTASCSSLFRWRAFNWFSVRNNCFCAKYASNSKSRFINISSLIRFQILRTVAVETIVARFLSLLRTHWFQYSDWTMANSTTDCSILVQLGFSSSGYHGSSLVMFPLCRYHTILWTDGSYVLTNRKLYTHRVCSRAHMLNYITWLCSLFFFDFVQYDTFNTPKLIMCQIIF